MIIIILMACILLTPMIAGADETTENMAILISLTLVDYRQSVDMFYESDGYTELNPILGTNPSRAEMLAFGMIGVGLTYLMADTLPKPWKQILLDSIIASERFNIEENRRAFTGWNPSGPPVRGREINGIPIVISIRF